MNPLLYNTNPLYLVPGCQSVSEHGTNTTDSVFSMAIIAKNPLFCNIFLSCSRKAGNYLTALASTTLIATPAAVAISPPARVYLVFLMPTEPKYTLMQ